jgi:hypothetical protein
LKQLGSCLKQDHEFADLVLGDVGHAHVAIIRARLQISGFAGRLQRKFFLHGAAAVLLILLHVSVSFSSDRTMTKHTTGIKQHRFKFLYSVTTGWYWYSSSTSS